ncbi:MAG: phenylalanine--tRNA ligase subunit alpha [Candidatus Vogelbacteria bacterium]|nr:phenylalanine--tRNA ligase subunit alpha [Candidatus Vogelbacteria bacterium]
MERYPDQKLGHLHPLSKIITESAAIFAELGFNVADGPELETPFHNFDALNIPEGHPARAMHDTFWIDPERLLRTHTSPVQIRYMQSNKPPLRIIVPGKVFRNEATDATHGAQFYQLEGLYIDKQVSLGHLKGTLQTFFSRLFGRELAIRFRPSFFPFVEPGVEVDVKCFKCAGPGATCSVCKGTGWIEILGAGLVHPHVLKSVGLESNQWQGYAFGVGLDRLAMLKYGIDDVRLLYSGDLRFINQF